MALDEKSLAQHTSFPPFLNLYSLNYQYFLFSMFAFIFGGISRLFHKWDAVCIDNHVFRLHYRGTVIIFLAAIALVSGYSVLC